MVFDAVVIGAGPSGSWTAHTLARHGARVAIVDGSHPREKPCGGGVTGRALALVGDAMPRALPAIAISTARFVDEASGRSAAVPLEAHGIDAASALVVTSRRDFDAALLQAAQQAGATLLNTRATNVSVDANGARIDTRDGSIRARVLIGADGANSLVRRRVAEPFPRRALSIATGYFAHGVTSREIVIELMPDPPGYIWSFPRADHLAIGICAQADAGVSADALRAITLDWIRRTNIAPGARLEPYSWPIPSLDAQSLRALALAGPSWYTVGDAAGLVDPITREGIYFALRSGAWAAESILAGNPASYLSRIRDEIVPELSRAARLKTGFFRPAFTRLVVRALAQSPPIASVMADLIAGRQPYANLKWRLVKTMEWRLAWQVLCP